MIQKIWICPEDTRKLLGVLKARARAESQNECSESLSQGRGFLRCNRHRVGLEDSSSTGAFGSETLHKAGGIQGVRNSSPAPEGSEEKAEPQKAHTPSLHTVPWKSYKEWLPNWKKLKAGSFKSKDLKFHPALLITYCFRWDLNQSQMLHTFECYTHLAGAISSRMFS